jgi:hypothetical protein
LIEALLRGSEFNISNLMISIAIAALPLLLVRARLSIRSTQ